MERTKNGDEEVNESEKVEDVRREDEDVEESIERRRKWARKAAQQRLDAQMKQKIEESRELEYKTKTKGNNKEMKQEVSEAKCNEEEQKVVKEKEVEDEKSEKCSKVVQPPEKGSVKGKK